ncbi:MAG: hypothetical protein BMS9Abin32_193 [Gammaproteobacteria bacterium]|nr:MAG: hypothetical protein BMS9Abin32_193 [Gammaproteobacteria bacterium]
MAILRTVAIVIVALHAAQLAGADKLRLSDDSTILVSADESWEDAEQDKIHFRGNFDLRTPRWSVSADEATVYGKLDDPQRVVADGSPVQFFFQDPDDAGSTTQGQGEHLQFEVDAQLLTLTGDALLSNGGRVMRSGEIRFDLEQQKLAADGPEGVHVTVDPADPGEP